MNTALVLYLLVVKIVANTIKKVSTVFGMRLYKRNHFQKVKASGELNQIIIFSSRGNIISSIFLECQLSVTEFRPK